MIAVVGVLVYPVGIVVYTFTVLKRNRHKPHVMVPLATFVALLTTVQKDNLPPAANDTGAQPL